MQTKPTLHEQLCHAVRRARVCSMDAIHASKLGRPDIAAQLRKARDVYKGRARMIWMKTA